MQHLINKNVQNIELPAIRGFSERVSKLKNSINLTIGQPDFFTPDHIKIAGKQAIDENKTTYTHNAGTAEVRKAASQYVYTKYGLTYDWEDEVIITTGAAEALDLTFRTILEEGCEVILAGPVYLGYKPLIELCGATPVYVDVTNNGFKLTADLIEENITEKTRCVILSYPSNPAGVTLNKQELNQIGKLLKDKEIFIVSDEIYSELVYDDIHCSIGSVSELRNQTIIINGLSKSHSMTGWRIGLLFAPAYLAKAMLKIHIYSVSCASSISQQAALVAMTKGASDPIIMRDEYRKRRDYVYSRLISMGFDVIKPQGAFYIFPSIKQFSMKSFEFANLLLEKQQVAVVPGSAFSKMGEFHIRISFANSLDILEDGLNRIENFIDNLNSYEINGLTIPQI